MEPLQFCDLCFAKEKSNLCETYKGTFTKISPLHFSIQNKLDRILTKLDLQARRVDGRWTCVTDSKRKEFLDFIGGIGVSVHTLEEHAKVLSRLYKPDARTLGAAVPVELSVTESWEEFDPKSRNWVSLKVTKKDDKFIGLVHLGNILKSSGVSGKNYFRTNLDKNTAALVPMEKRAAYNIASTIAQQITIPYKTDGTGEHVFVDIKCLGIIPDEISSFLERVGRKNRKILETFIFDVDDLELVKSILGSIKISLERSSDIVTIVEKTSDVLIPIDQIETKRLEVMSYIVQEMGGTISTENDGITISGKRGQVKVTFVEDDKSTQDGTTIRISISALEEPSRFAEILSMIKKRLGLLDLPLDSIISVRWPIITDSDLQYVVQSAISWYSSNPVLAYKIISEADKLEKIKQWYSKIKEGKIRSSLDTITLGKIIRMPQFRNSLNA
jgi:hypothetical protein